MRDNQKPFVTDLILSLIDRTNDGTIQWITNKSLTKGSRYHFDLNIDNTEIDVKVELDPFSFLPKKDGWLNIKDPNLSESILASPYTLQEVVTLQSVLYNKYIQPQIQKIKDTDAKDIETLSNITNKFGKQYIRDRKLSTILGPDELTIDPKLEPTETWKDRVKKILNK